MKNLKERGITLVALIITIVVLLILAGVTLNIVLNSGIISKSQIATSKYNEQATKEKLTLALTEYKFKQLAGESPNIGEIISNIGGEITGGTENGITEWTIYLDEFIFTVDKKTNEIKSIEPSNLKALNAPLIGTPTITLAGDSKSATIEVTATSQNEGGELTVTIDNKTATLENGKYKATVTANGTKTITVTEKVGTRRKTATVTASVTGIQEPTLISKSTTGDGYVGCYADIDGDFDGTNGIDGIIYADLLVGKPTSGNWNNDSNATFEIRASDFGLTSENVKNYVVSSTPVIDSRFDSTARYVVSLASGDQSSKKDRFFVMGLNDIKDTENHSSLYWYINTYGKMPATPETSTDFGAGKANTETMINIYYERNGKTKYADQNDRDLWKNIDTQVSQGWFVPSRGEWAAFAKAFNISNTLSAPTCYNNFGLEVYYWSSSQIDKYETWYAYFSSGCMTNGYVSNAYCVRLSKTF